MGILIIVSSYVQSHIRVLEAPGDNIAALLMGLEYLIKISYVDDTEVFKVKKFMIFFLVPCLHMQVKSELVKCMTCNLLMMVTGVLRLLEFICVGAI